MISVWWLIPAFMAGEAVAFIVVAIVYGRGKDDD